MRCERRRGSGEHHLGVGSRNVQQIYGRRLAEIVLDRMDSGEGPVGESWPMTTLSRLPC